MACLALFETAPNRDTPPYCAIAPYYVGIIFGYYFVGRIPPACLLVGDFKLSDGAIIVGLPPAVRGSSDTLASSICEL